MRGILLAGGRGSRLDPITRGVSKQLLPVYDKPLIYYPLSTLMLAGVREILVVTTPHDLAAFQRLLGEGDRFGVELSYGVQEAPRGVADALLVGADHVGGESVALALGDNVFHGSGLGRRLVDFSDPEGGVVFAVTVADATPYAVVELDESGVPRSLEEKPTSPRSNLAVPGLYFYEAGVADLAAALHPSQRGELEITDVNRELLRQGRLRVESLPRGTTWFDTSTVEALHDASTYVRALEQRHGIRIGSPEEVGWRNGWLTDQGLVASAGQGSTDYARYLRGLLTAPRRG